MVVEEVEEIRRELKASALGDPEVLGNRNIHVLVRRPIDRRNGLSIARVAEG